VPWAFDAVKGERWERTRYGGRELQGKTIGLVGYGRLGRMVAGYARAFGMEVVAHDPAAPTDGVEAVTLEELLKSMRDHDIQTNSLVTTGEGKLLGVISRADAEATLAHEAPAETAPGI